MENNKGGMNSSNALNVLREDISNAIYEFELAKPFYRKERLLWDFSWHNFQTLLDFYGCVVIVAQIILILLAYEYADAVWYESLIAEVLFLFCLFIGNVTFKIWDSKVKHYEIVERAKFLLKYLEDCSKVCKWEEKNYPNLYSPFSPSITLQPTLRDKRLVNLPWCLLVRGDCIQLRPGQAAPGKCRVRKDQSEGAADLEAKGSFDLNEVYSPTTEHESPDHLVKRLPLQPLYCILEETPYIRNLTTVLQRAQKRPTSSVEKERYLLFIMGMEHFGIAIAVVILYAINIIRYFYISQSLGSCSWIDLFLMQPVAATLPLTPIIFPVLWRLINAGGLAWILALFYTSRKQQVSDDPFEEATVSPQPHRSLFAKSGELKKYFMRTLKGDRSAPAPFRTQNLLHTLGRVTALCCLDKKGILSWPNPTAEKVFFLRTGKGEEEEEKKKKHKITSEFCTQIEVLDLTHDMSSPFRLQFDDQSWKRHLGNLKPLGLAILLNTCNGATHWHYCHFCSHLTCESMADEHSVSVANRRFSITCEYTRRRLSLDEVVSTLPICFRWCLCEVAFEIGFSREIQSSYALETQLSTFRHLQTSSKEQKLAHSLSLSKLKFPFPHMVAVSVQEKFSEDHHMFSQGTGELVVDSCADFWDGVDVVPLTNSDRKKVLDFYHRTSLTAYCTAFAYRPLDRGISSELSDFYIQVPADSEPVYQTYRSPTPNDWDGLGRLVEENTSTDSAFGNTTDFQPTSSVDDAFRIQSNQTFVGMVTMQYQAKIDMVHMIEQLDRACIRFVHFSKENELRSRVFSEKMGLESGWNCHISLLCGEETDDIETEDIYCSNGSAINRSVENVAQPKMRRNASNLSAPSAINMEMSQVKFGDEVSIHSLEAKDDDEEEYSSTDSLADKRKSSHHRSAQSMRSESRSSLLVTSETNLSRSQSHITESTDQSAPNVPFDMQNRAKLPKGIKNIRPHIENVDNVPLLVSLFTDCTPEATEEMIQIMQDYGEIVCIIGSSSNPQNVGAFMTGDASLAVDPLYPQLCQSNPAFELPTTLNGPSPVEISRRLNSLPCALSFHRDELSSLLHLILESRHMISCFRNVMQFWTCCCSSITLMHILSALVMLPPILSSGQSLWLSFVIVPLLAVSLLGLPTDPEILKEPTEKLPRSLSKELIGFIIWCYGGKFLPSMLVVVLLYALCTMGFCWDIVLKSRTLSANVTYEQCIYVYPLEKGNIAPDNWSQPELELAWFKAQHYACVFFVLYIIVISFCFVNRYKHFWQSNPFRNRLWIGMCFLVFVLHWTYMSLTLYDLQNQDTMYKPDFSVIPVPIWLIAFLWPLVLLGINEAIKRNEIRTRNRLQKRARLEFGTKLGMNSPF